MSSKPWAIVAVFSDGSEHLLCISDTLTHAMAIADARMKREYSDLSRRIVRLSIRAWRSNTDGTGYWIHHSTFKSALDAARQLKGKREQYHRKKSEAAFNVAAVCVGFFALLAVLV